jgi:hypothetical protein
MTCADGRDSGHAELLCGLHPTMARYDAVRAVDQDRTDKAEFLNARSNLSDLLRAMRAWIAVPASELGRVLKGYLQGRHHPIQLTELWLQHNPGWKAFNISVLVLPMPCKHALDGFFQLTAR